MPKTQPTLNESLAVLVRGVLARVRALEAAPYGDVDVTDELAAMDSDLQVILSLLRKVQTIPAGTMGTAYAPAGERDDTVVAVIELALAELQHLTRVCGHDGFGMLPEAAEGALAEMGGAL